MVRQGDARLALHAEHLDRQPAHGAGHAVAIEVERIVVGGDDVGVHVHLHAVDDGDEVGLLQAEVLHRLDQERRLPRLAACIEAGQVAAPGVQRRGAAGAVALLVVGDVVHRPAEGVDGEHARPLPGRHGLHGRIEGALAHLLFEGGDVGAAAQRLPIRANAVRAIADSAMAAIFGLS